MDLCENDFSYSIRERGEDYYYDGNVIECSKTNYGYLAKVRGSSVVPYEVSITIKNGQVSYNCDCPCTYPCKHEYAVLMAISNQEYDSIELKEKISEKKGNLKSIIKDIPAEEIKSYLLSPIGLNKVCFEMNSFNKYFRKYLPNQDYEFYYNNLYNSLVLSEKVGDLINDNLERVKEYVFNSEYFESFKIIKATVEAYHDSNYLNFDDRIIELFSPIGICLRTAYKKGNDLLKEEINDWIKHVEDENYYNNFYLQDMLESVKII